MQCREMNNKHPCEFLLTRAIKLLHVIPLRLLTSNAEKRPIISPISTKAQLYNKKTWAMGRLVEIGFPVTH
jgi:hypothetical protein